MPDSKKSYKWSWMPAMVFLIGILSIVLLLWVHRTSDRLDVNSYLIEAIMDIQIQTATYHLRLEEALYGYASAKTDAKEALAALDQAINLIEVTLNGGKTEHNWVLEPFTDPALRARAAAIKPLLEKIKVIGLERLKDREKAGIGSVLEHRFEKIYKEVLGRTRELEDILEIYEARDQEKSRRLFRGILVIWAFLVVTTTAGIWHRERQRKSAEEKLLKANELLLSQADELTGHRERLAELVEKRTAELTDANELLRVEITERRQTEKILRETERQVRCLASELINAQEIERRRISRELHDELGQALNVTKLRIRAIEKGLKEDQQTAREECEGLLGYMDHVIEDVRRLSLDLSPTALEDLGLTSAIQWLIRNFRKIPTMKITSDVEEIDHLYSSNHWITIYRVIQEALTNIGKHAHAENISVVVRRNDDMVNFFIEDDGKGFDLKQAVMKDAPERGLGMMTMNERVKMMGGVLDFWSQEGKGTRVAFRIPVEKGDAYYGSLPDCAC